MATRENKRVACIDLPDLPLQILRRARPELAGHPLAVVAEDRPDAPLTHVDALGARLKLAPGMRWGAARNLVPALRAAPVSEADVARTVEELVVSLQTFSPRVEPDLGRPGAFYVDPGGLDRIYGGLPSWAHAVRAYLEGRGFRAGVVVGFDRFATFALARSTAEARVIGSAAKERALLEAVPIAALMTSPRLRDDLGVLGVHTLGDLVGLPAGELRSRFGDEASQLAELAAGDPQLPMQPRALDEPVRVELEVEPPDDDHSRLLFAIKGALHELLRRVAERAMVLGALRIELAIEREPAHVERIEPAAPTRDAMLLLDLVRLRLGDVALPGPVAGIALEAELARAEGDQLAMFRVGPKRDLAAGERALARVRAAFGAGAVTRARLREAHLPEARFAWEPVAKLRLARHVELAGGVEPFGDVASRPDERADPLVRRVLARPRPLASRDRSEPDEGPDLGDGDSILRLFGPYRVSGGWWVRTVERDYFYAETAAGELLWVYWDRPRHRWYLHGVVD